MPGSKHRERTGGRLQCAGESWGPADCSKGGFIAMAMSKQISSALSPTPQSQPLWGQEALYASRALVFVQGLPSL